MLERGAVDCVCHHMKIENKKPNLSDWIDMVNRQKNATKKLLLDWLENMLLCLTLLSVAEALRHGGIYMTQM